ASAQVVESKVTSKLEGMMARVEGVKHIRSVSDKGGGQLTLELDRHVKRDDVRLEISSLIRQLWPQLPEGVTYPEIFSRMPDDEDEDGARPFQVYTLAASAQPQAIQQYGEDYVKPVLADIKDLYKVEFTGAVPMEWHLNYDTKLLEDNGVSVNQVETAVRNYLQEISLGLFQLEGEEGLFRITASRLGKDGQLDLSKLSLTNRVGQSVALDRLVTLTHQEGIPQSYFRINGRNSIYMTLTATKEANQLVLAQRVKKALEQVRASLPAGYSIQPDYDSTEEIQKELDNILFRTGLTILLLLLFVVLITRDTRYTFLVVASLAVNQAVAFVLYYLADLEIHLYSLAGITISINLVIDNIIVMADHVRHKHNLNAFLPILAATLTTMSALCMVFFLDEKLLMNLRDFALVVIVNMGVSLAAALLLVPALMDLLGMAGKGEKGVETLKKHRWQLRSQQAY
ncbi:MAG: efflux RND transporter permease subunit, partial [Bacteroidaceae bacterium]|nr:efflux RND transporter permease subunit [Bacteroidaceae bacterium]